MILPKKPQILYAPMLATFGGGSSRGFGRGIGGGFDFGLAHHPIFGENMATAASNVAPITINSGSLQSADLSTKGSAGAATEVYLDETGTNLITGGYASSNNTVEGWTLSTAWDLSTVSSSKSFNYNLPHVSSNTNLAFAHDGSAMVYGGRTQLWSRSMAANTTYNPNGSSALNGSSGSLTGFTINNCQGVGFNNDGTIFWYYERSTDRFVARSLTTAYNIASGSQIYAVDPFYPRNVVGNGNAYGTQMSGDGLAFAILDMSDGDIHFWRMTSAYDMRTRTDYRKVDLRTANIITSTSVMGLQIVRFAGNTGYLYTIEPFSTNVIKRWDITFN